jgi:uncharacterized membrane protein
LINLCNKILKLTKSKIWWANKVVKQVVTCKSNVQLPTFQTFQYPTRLQKKKEKVSSSRNQDLEYRGKKCETWLSNSMLSFIIFSTLN